MSGWATALRIARREAVKSKGRSALVVAMIGLPVAFLAFAAVSYDMFNLTARERLERRMGSADALVAWQHGPPHEGFAGAGKEAAGAQDRPQVPDELLDLLPPGSRVIPIARGSVRVRTPYGADIVDARVGDVSDPLLRGMATLVKGTAPQGTRQIAVNRAMADRFGLDLGETIMTAVPERAYTVTAFAEYQDALQPLAIFATDVLGPTNSDRSWLVDTPGPVDAALGKQLQENGFYLQDRALSLRTGDSPIWLVDAGTAVNGAVIVALAIVEIVLLAGPAFAVGAKRKAHDLALIACAGGEPKQLRRIVLADGIVLGLTGALCGLGVGVILAVAGRPILEELTQSRAGGYRFFPLALLGIAALAVGTGVLAATVPAFVAARQEVVLALSGRRGAVRARKRWIAAGAAMTALGVVVSVLGTRDAQQTAILAGVVLGELGIVVMTPALVGLICGASSWLPLAPRLALRDIARNRSSAAPAISAIMAAVAGAVATGVLVGGEHQRQVDLYQPLLPVGYSGIRSFDRGGPPADWLQVEAAVRRTLPEARIESFNGLRCPDGVPVDAHCGLVAVLPQGAPCHAERSGPQTEADLVQGCWRTYSSAPFADTVVDSEGRTVSALTRAAADDVGKARDVLARGGVVVTDPRYVKDGKVTLMLFDGSVLPRGADRPALVVPGYALSTGTAATALFVSPRIARMAGLATEIHGLVAVTTTPPTAQQEERLEAIVNAMGTAILWVERGPERRSDPIGLVMALAAAAIALAAAGVATRLVSADSRADLGILAAVGADPAVRRLLTLSRAGVISGLGAVLGTLTGAGAAAIMIFSMNRFTAGSVPPVPIEVPPETVAIVLAVPLVAMAAAGLVTRSRLPIERRL